MEQQASLKQALNILRKTYTCVNKHLYEFFLLFLYFCVMHVLCFKTINIDFSFISIPACLIFGMNTIVQYSTLFVILWKMFMSVHRNTVGLLHKKMLRTF